MINELVSVSESVIFIANISVIGISVILHISAPLMMYFLHHYIASYIMDIFIQGIALHMYICII